MTCPLCNSSNVSGPIGISTPTGAVLKWHCYRCGYTWLTTPAPASRSNWRHATQTIVKSLAIWAGLALLVWLDAQTALSDVPTTSAWLVAVFKIVGEALLFLGQKALTLATVLYHVSILLGRALFEFGTLLAGTLGRLGSFLQRFWLGVLRPAIDATWRAVDRLSRFLDRVTRPVLHFLERVRFELLKYYDRFFRPILDTIQLTRQVLHVLGALHVTWARELEDKLWALEDRLTRPLIAVMRRLNEVSDWVNRIVTLDGTLQRLTLLRSIQRDIAYIRGAWVRAFSRPLTEGDYARLRQASGARTLTDIKRDTADVLTSGGGRYGPAVSEMAAQWRIYIRDAGVTRA